VTDGDRADLSVSSQILCQRLLAANAAGQNYSQGSKQQHTSFRHFK
jgi:hypothetical protein